MKTRLILSLPILLLLHMSLAAADTRLEEAKKCFERYMSLEAAFDPVAADLYTDDAKIQNTRIYPDGQKKVMTLPAPTYKNLIRQTMQMAKQRGDSNKYSEVKYAIEGDKVRVQATRYSNLKKYSSPLSLLLAPNKDGIWLIHEELSVSQP